MEYKYKEIKRSSKTNSANLNKTNKAIANDVFELFKKTLTNEEIINAENAANADTISAMTNRINTLEALVNTANNNTIITAYDMPSYPASIQETGQAKSITEFGELTLPVLQRNIYLMNFNEETGEYELAADAGDYIEHYLTNNRYDKRVNKIEQNNIMRAFNGNISEAYYVKAYTDDSSIDKITQVVTVSIPEEDIVNTIRLIPVPEFGVNIPGISYNSSSITGAQIKNVLSTSVFQPLTNAPRFIWHTLDTPMKELTIKLERTVFNEVQGVREFRLGTRTISVENNEYSNIGYAIYSFTAKTSSLLDIELDWIADGESSAYLYSTQQDVDDVNDNYILRNDAEHLTPPSPLTVVQGNTYYLLIKLEKIKATGATPIFYGANIKWG